ncbi:lutropin-choriogonadotropic hormone receptor-like [Engraulis encrasicolus]|uniref:lutropin-choriogonadotropic hormone receptor-like n=1 Tax=Engraulis encrasicolus TaxID=184585 RepID=UPI002FD591B3
MPLRTAVLVVLLWSVQHVSTAWTFDCPSVCQCTSDSLSCTRETQERLPTPSSRPLWVFQLPQKEIQSGSFKRLVNISRIEISQSNSLQRIRRQAFLSLKSVTEIAIQNIKNLEVIETGAFTDIPQLRYLSICNTGITHFPDLSFIYSLKLTVLEIGDNIRLEGIPSNAFVGIPQYENMNLVRNGFKEIESHAFNGTQVNTLNLEGNWYLHTIHSDAFEGTIGPVALDVSSTSLSSLPARGLRQVQKLTARSTPTLKTLPPLDSLQSLVETHLTYPSHCCAFHTWQRQNPVNLTWLCNEGVGAETMDLGTTSGGAMADYYPDLVDLCGTSAPLRCTPEPDDFNPCEDLLGSGFLRSATWVVTTLAVAGNSAVLLVLLSSRQKLSISRFLMCHLAFADLCMGVYLFLIAAMDHRSRRQYYNHATDWQTGAGCGVAGFLTVFASELSVYTLTMITLERWHTIAHAMEAERRLKLRHVAAMMAVGWLFSLLVALLPLLGVSSYSKVSICLPMDIETPAAQGYVVMVLLLNVLAFLVVCVCYVRIYLSVRNPSVASRRGDAKMAKRMAVLIFTDFLCMAPISFFAISAALRMPLITVSHSKILLVLFYPINSLCNPFLYTIFTRAFRRDIWQLLGRCGCCCQDGVGVGVGVGGGLFPAKGFGPPGQLKPPKRKAPSKKARSLQFYAYHIKMQGCLLSKGTT